MNILNRVTAGTFLAAAALLIPVSSASAHGSTLESSIPEPNVAITEIPNAIEITFSERLKSSPAAISVLDPSGTQIVSSSASVDGGTVSAELTAPDPVVSGVYKVTYQVLFEDGASVRAKYEFTVNGPSALEPDSEPSPDDAQLVDESGSPALDEPDVKVSAGPVGDTVVVAEETTAAGSTTSTDSSGSGSAPVLIGGLLLGVLLLGGGLMYFVRSRSN